jgi:hypothetical protein
MPDGNGIVLSAIGPYPAFTGIGTDHDDWMFPRTCNAGYYDAPAHGYSFSAKAVVDVGSIAAGKSKVVKFVYRRF